MFTCVVCLKNQRIPARRWASVARGPWWIIWKNGSARHASLPATEGELLQGTINFYLTVRSRPVIKFTDVYLPFPISPVDISHLTFSIRTFPLPGIELPSTHGITSRREAYACRFLSYNFPPAFPRFSNFPFAAAVALACCLLEYIVYIVYVCVCVCVCGSVVICIDSARYGRG